MRNKRYYTPKRDILPFLITSQIEKIIEVKQYANSVKTTFECRVDGRDENIRCVYWRNPDIHVGDTVSFKCWRSASGVFVVESLTIYRDTQNEPEKTNE